MIRHKLSILVSKWYKAQIKYRILASLNLAYIRELRSSEICIFLTTNSSKEKLYHFTHIAAQLKYVENVTNNSSYLLKYVTDKEYLKRILHWFEETVNRFKTIYILRIMGVLLSVHI